MIRSVMRLISRQVFYLGLILGIGALAQSLLLLALVQDAGVNDTLLKHAGAIRTGVQRYAKLVLAGERVHSAGIASDVDRSFGKICGPIDGFSWYREERNEFRLAWSNLFPIWNQIHALGASQLERPSAAKTAEILSLSEDFTSARRSVADFVDQLREKKVLLFGTAASTGGLFLLGVLLLLLINHRSIRGRLEPMALTDPLTGLLNRDAFYSRLPHNPDRQRGTLLMCDIDHFKRVNDTYGHDLGDEVLKKLAQTLGGMLRNDELFSRFGGEEFAIWLPRIGFKEATQVANRLRVAIEKTHFDQVGNITVSIGGAEWRPGDAFEKVYKMADQALYQAKEAGRNRAIMWTQSQRPR